MKKVFCVILALLTAALSGCSSAPPAREAAPQSGLSLPEDFILGMDASCVPALEKSGVTYYGFDGAKQDVFKTLSESGINYIRVRVWNHPFDESGNGYGGGNCDIQNALAIGKRATLYGMKLLVNFHYSDFWADPGKQAAPLAWQGMTLAEKADALYLYTRESLRLLKDGGVDVGMVQVGNETNGKMCGETAWDRIGVLMNAGSKAVREVFPDAQVAVHFANPEKSGAYSYYAAELDRQQVDYDIFASSYYPYWHGSLENLYEVLSGIWEGYGKKVMVAETSYAYTDEDSDFWSNTISADSQTAKPYPYTPQGQAEAVKNVIRTVSEIPGSVGIFYWEGTWISVGGDSLQANQALWEQHGSGWASSYSAVYDPEDAGKWFGGCAVENQAMFDKNGRPLSSLTVFQSIRE